MSHCKKITLLKNVVPLLLASYSLTLQLNYVTPQKRTHTANTAQRSDWFFTEAVSCENRDRARDEWWTEKEEKTALRSASEAPLLCVSVWLSHVGPSVLEAFCSPSLRRPLALLILWDAHAHTHFPRLRDALRCCLSLLHRATPRYTHTRTRTQQISALALTPNTSPLQLWQN